MYLSIVPSLKRLLFVLRLLQGDHVIKHIKVQTIVRLHFDVMYVTQSHNYDDEASAWIGTVTQCGSSQRSRPPREVSKEHTDLDFNVSLGVRCELY